jgi:hypothetical protein
MSTIKNFEELKAWRSADEVQLEPYFALDAGPIKQEQIKQAYDLAVETNKLIHGMISYLSKG